MYAYTQNNPVMYIDISGESPVNILKLIGYESPIIWQIGKPYSNQVFIRKGNYGNGGTGRVLYIDFSGSTLSYNQFTAFDLEIGVLSFEQDFHGLDFAVDFLSISAKAGIGTELTGYEFVHLFSQYQFKESFLFPVISITSS
jgi:hypothetical protein